MSLDITGIGAVATAVSDIVDKFFPSADEKTKATLALELQEIAERQASDTAQAQINNTEAASGNWYASNWRPTCAWVCVCSFAWVYLIEPIAAWIIALLGHSPLVVPAFDSSVMLPVLFSLLGLGAMRSVDKFNGVAKR